MQVDLYNGRCIMVVDWLSLYCCTEYVKTAFSLSDLLVDVMSR